jgi:hypothetical protein
MIFHVYCNDAPYLTLVVRAYDENEARRIGRDVAGEYLDHKPQVTVGWIDPDGPPGVIVEDPS